jgi:HSP20 family protein
MYRRYRVVNPWREMDHLQRDLNRLFEDYSPANRVRRAPAYPALNVWNNEEGLIVTAEVPGLRSEDIEINVVGDTLTLSGVRKPDEMTETGRYHRQERGNGSFHRSVQLPYPIDVAKVDATFRNGVLNVKLPRAEELKPRKIKVKSS